MYLIVNGEDRQLTVVHLADVLRELDLAGALVATAVNGEFVAKSTRATHRLSPGDRVEIVAPMKGG